MPTDKEILAPLIDQVNCHANKPEQEEKKIRWANHQALLGTDRAPVAVYWNGIPKKSWNEILGDNFLKCQDETAIEIEYFLRRVLYMAENVDDDTIVWPIAKFCIPYKQLATWGIEMKGQSSKEELGAYALSAPFKDEINMAALTEPQWEIDQEAWEIKEQKFDALIGNSLQRYHYYWNLEFSPFDTAAIMCGLESLMIFAITEPEKLHELMNFITNVYKNHHFKRDALGEININPDASNRFHIHYEARTHCSWLNEEFKINRIKKLKYEWPYISAQTSSGYGPDMYNEFVHQYDVKLAEMFPNNNVYYHGCETLDQKAAIIKNLPHLRRFHVSPWTNIDKAVEAIQGKAVMEVHTNPSDVFFGWGEKQIRKNITDLLKRGQGFPMDLNLSDIHNVNNKPELLNIWARIAKEESIKYGSLFPNQPLESLEHKS